MSRRRKTPNILIVDDEPNFLRSLKDSLSLEKFRVKTARNALEAQEQLQTQQIDVVISDIRMPGLSGIELLSIIKREFPDIVVFMITGYGSIEDAVRCVKMGAENYILKPVNVQELILHIQDALRRREKLPNSTTRPRLIGESERIRRVRKLVGDVADSDLPILICGESGTGKELVAEMLFQGSSRRNKPFIKINCAALPEHLLESELFGYEAGAFTDARKRKPGQLELAHEGTVFLDEIGDMPLSMQAKLLRVLEEKRLIRLGGTEPVSTDFRIISATNQDLRELILKKQFREDLFYRLNAVEILLPPLREIPEDIPLLIQHFASEYAAANGLEQSEMEEELLAILLAYHWPGNVRELRNVIFRALVLARGGVIRREHLPEQLRGQSDIQKSFSLEEVEKAHIDRVLRLTKGNKNLTARLLKIHRDTLYRKLKKYSIR